MRQIAERVCNLLQCEMEKVVCRGAVAQEGMYWDTDWSVPWWVGEGGRPELHLLESKFSLLAYAQSKDLVPLPLSLL